MPRRWLLGPSVAVMEKSGLIFASSGDPPLLVLQIPAEIAAGSEASACFAVPILSRRGGLALAVPADALDSDAWPVEVLHC